MNYKNTICGILMAANILTGCKDGCNNNSVMKEGNFRGYKVNISAYRNDAERQVMLKDTTTKISASITGRATVADSTGKANQFDHINLFNVSKGHPILAYANPESLEVVYKTILEQK